MDSVVHFEVPAADLKRAAKFYAEAFGWRIKDVPGMDYTMVWTTETSNRGMPKRKGAINGGLMKRDKAATAPVVVINVKSLTRGVAKVQKAGGSLVMKKMKVGNMGWYARVKDSEGNVIGLWQNIPRKKSSPAKKKK